MLQKVLVKPNKKASRVYWQELSLFQEKNDLLLIVETISPPIDGKANKEVIELVSKFFNIKKAQISIKNGLNSKNKILEILL